MISTKSREAQPLINDNPSPANSGYEQAKKLYTTYCGNSFFMDREGDYEQYKQYDVPPALESQWRAERIETLVSQLTPDDCDLLIKLSLWNAKEALPRLMQLADGNDDYIQTRKRRAHVKVGALR